MFEMLTLPEGEFISSGSPKTSIESVDDHLEIKPCGRFIGAKPKQAASIVGRGGQRRTSEKARNRKERSTSSDAQTQRCKTQSHGMKYSFKK